MWWWIWLSGYSLLTSPLPFAQKLMFIKTTLTNQWSTSSYSLFFGHLITARCRVCFPIYWEVSEARVQKPNKKLSSVISATPSWLARPRNLLIEDHKPLRSNVPCHHFPIRSSRSKKTGYLRLIPLRTCFSRHKSNAVCNTKVPQASGMLSHYLFHLPTSQCLAHCGAH